MYDWDSSWDTHIANDLAGLVDDSDRLCELHLDNQYIPHTVLEKRPTVQSQLPIQNELTRKRRKKCV